MISRPEDPHPRDPLPSAVASFTTVQPYPPFSPFIFLPSPGSARWYKSTTNQAFRMRAETSKNSLYLSLSFYSETISCSSCSLFLCLPLPLPLPSIYLTLSISYSLPSQGWMYWRDFAATFRDKNVGHILISFPFADFGFLFSYLRFSCLLMSRDIIDIYDFCLAEILLVYFEQLWCQFYRKMDLNCII